MAALVPLFVVSVLASVPGAPPEPSRELKPVTRTVALTPENARDVLQVRVASKRSTWLVLPSDVKGPLPKRQELGTVEVVGNLVTVAPSTPLGPTQRVPLMVQLADGPALLFEVVGARDEYDDRVTVTLARAAPPAAPVSVAPVPPAPRPGSVEGLEEKLEQCRDELVDARSPAAAKEVLAGLVAASGDKAPALVRRELGSHFEESFVWVGLRQSYHLFDWVFVVLDVDNRQAGSKWVLGSVAIRQVGGGEPLPTSVENSRPQGLAAGERARVVIGFPVPADNTRRYVMTLTDKAGSRNVTLKDLDL